MVPEGGARKGDDPNSRLCRYDYSVSDKESFVDARIRMITTPTRATVRIES